MYTLVGIVKRSLGRERRPLTNSEKVVLSYILEKGPSHGFGIHDETGVTEKTTYTALKSLTKTGLLKPRAEGEGGKLRPGLEAKFYHLTLKGLVEGLVTNKGAWKKIDRIAEQWEGTLPLVFNKWNYITASGVRAVAIEQLERIITEVHSGLVDTQELPQGVLHGR